MQLNNIPKSIDVIRSLSRVNVSFPNQSVLSNYKFSSIDIIDRSNVESYSSSLTSQVLDENLSYNLAIQTDSLVRSIFMGESVCESDHIRCIVLGIKNIESDELKFYKIELIDKYLKPLTLLLNHSYNFQINDIADLHGANSVVDALYSSDSIVDYTLDIIDHSLHLINSTDGYYLLCMDKDRFNFSLHGGEADWLIYTDSPKGWSIIPDSFIVNNIKTQQPKDLKFNVCHSDIEVMNGMGELNYYLTLQIGTSETRTIQFEVQTNSSGIKHQIIINQE